MAVMDLDLTEDETLALAAQLKRAMAADRYPLSPRVQTLKAILAKLGPEAIGSRELLRTAKPALAHNAKMTESAAWTSGCVARPARDYRAGIARRPF
jgi:hypothetical protein